MGTDGHSRFAPLVLAGTATSFGILFARYPERMPPFLLGMGIEVIIQVLQAPTPYQIYEPWKWGYGLGALAIGLVLLSFFRIRSWIVMVAAMSFARTPLGRHRSRPRQ